jgi:hypothetical protein
MELPDFVAKQNIARFGAQLISETDATRRAELQRLLIQEEDRLGFRYEQFDEIEREIAKAEKRIEFQQAVIETMEREGRDTRVAKALLENMTQIQLIYKQYRQKILAALDRSKL